MLHYLGVAVLLIAFNTDPAGAVCGTTPIIWRNDNITCPARAICADKFETTRDWFNGTRCAETRVLSNCVCPGNMVCPVNDDRYMIFASSTQKQYICIPKCQLPWCGNIQLGSAMGGQRDTSRRGSAVVALTFEQNADEFENRNYYKISCRCPRHHFPSTQRRSRAVKAYRYRYNYTLRRYYTTFTCNNRRSDPHHEDPCPPQ